MAPSWVFAADVDGDGDIDVLSASRSDDQTTQVNMPLAFTEFRGNPISTSDADAGDEEVEVTLSGEHGQVSVINVNPNDGLTYSEGDGTADATMTFSGTLSDVNAALSWVAFIPEVDYVGSEASLTITTNDLGNTGAGGALEDSDTISIEVTAVPSFADSPTHETVPGALDPDFGTDGVQILSVSEAFDEIRQLKLLDDGKILAVGAVNNHFGLLRFESDLTLDDTFGESGVVETDLGDGNHARTVTIDGEGRFLVGGNLNLVRYTSAGELDETFGEGGVVENSWVDVIHGVAIQADGKIVVAGKEDHQFRITRYDPDGSLDAAFGDREYNVANGDTLDWARGVAAQDDGDILMGGTGNSFDHFSMLTIDNAGGRGAEYSYDWQPGDFAHSMLSLPDGKYLLIGRSGASVAGHPEFGPAGQFLVSRYLSSGELDTTFGASPEEGRTRFLMQAEDNENVGEVPGAFRGALQPDGKIVVAGTSHNGSGYDFGVARLSYDGALDDTFDDDGKLAFDLGDEDVAYDVLVQADGKLLIAGRSGDQIALVRLLGDSGGGQAPENSLPGDDKIAWYENDGNQNFTERVISTNADNTQDVFAADVDGDGDIDVLSASVDDDKIAWYENDGSQNFTERVISTAADNANTVFATDVDGDGDIDVLSASGADDKIAWYENPGTPTTGAISLTAGGTITVTAAGSGVSAIDGNVTLDASVVNSDVVVEAAIGTSGTGSVALTASGTITVDSSISSTGSALDIDFNATAGVDINSNITTNGGTFNSDGTTFDNTGGTISTGDGAVVITHTGAVTLGAVSAASLTVASSGAAITDSGTLTISRRDHAQQRVRPI